MLLRQAVWQHIQDRMSLLSHVQFLKLRPATWAALGHFFMRPQMICAGQKLSPPLPSALKNSPLALFPKIMSFLFQRILGMCWLVTQRIQHFPLVLPNPISHRLPIIFLLCSPLTAFFSLPLPGISLGLGIMPVSQVHYPDYRVFVSKKKWGICLFVLRSESGIKMQTQ